MNRTLCIRPVASLGPIDRHRAKVKELLQEVQIRRAKAEKINQEFVTKNQMILKQIFQDEVNYIKSIFEKTEEVDPSVPIVESEVIMSEDYERDSSK